MFFGRPEHLAGLLSGGCKTKNERQSPEAMTPGICTGKRPREFVHLAERPTQEDDCMRTVQEHLLRLDLKCPICLRIMREPTATDCLHRFCKDCIETAHRQTGGKQCPTCRKPIATRRSLRPDPNIAALIAKLYPDLDSFEAEDDCAAAPKTEELRREHSRNMQAVRARQKERQAAYELDRKKGKIAARVEYDAAYDEFIENESDENESDDRHEEGDHDEYHAAAWMRPRTPAARPVMLTPESFELGFRLQPHPLEARLAPLERDYVCVSCLARVRHLQGFLAVQYAAVICGSPDAVDNFHVHVVTQEHNYRFVHVSPETSLYELLQQHHLDSSALRLRFRYTGACPGDVVKTEDPTTS